MILLVTDCAAVKCQINAFFALLGWLYFYKLRPRCSSIRARNFDGGILGYKTNFLSHRQQSYHHAATLYHIENLVKVKPANVQ